MNSLLFNAYNVYIVWYDLVRCFWVVFFTLGAAWVHFPRTDLPGNDLDELMYGENIMDAAKCLLHCLQDPRCKGIIDVPGSRCYTKFVNRWQNGLITSNCCNYYDLNRDTQGSKTSLTMTLYSIRYIYPMLYSSHISQLRLRLPLSK